MLHKSRRFSLIACLLVVLAAPTVSAETVPLTDRHIEIIRTNCRAAQSSAQSLQRTEAATRVSRGREYESISNLLVALNSRVALNKLNAPALTSATAEMEQRFTAFKNDYSKYEDALTAMIRLTCKEQPVTFYDSLNNVRELRAKVAGDIVDINETLDAYKVGLDQLRASVTVGSTR